MTATKHQRISIGFAGGQVLASRVSQEQLKSLELALATQPGWHEIAAEDGTVRLDLGQVVYLRVESDEPRVGFGL
jgi:hypothetical protein